MRQRVALYARYSTDLQSDASIEDQLRLCRKRAEREGWTVVESYSDRAISGASLLRPGIQALMEDAGRGRFDIVLAEAMDRLSRDQEDIAGLFKRLRFAGVAIMTIAEGVPGPTGRGWRDTTIRGHALRGTGILRNELYIGRLVRNRRHFVKDPTSSSRVARTCPAVRPPGDCRSLPAAS